MRTSWLLLFMAVAATSVADDIIDFNRDVRPILSRTCLQCHGPDESARRADLRLDQPAAAQQKLASGDVAVVPGDVTASAIIARITARDPDVQMPPPDSENQLSAIQIDILKQWIAQGAKYAKHWAYIAPQTPSVPDASADLSAWAQNSIDNFTLQQMQSHGLQPSPPADRYALIRRVSLDLTGLPPTVEEADTFAATQDLDAYETLVDELLQRDSFGEHWARKWLDLARYADSAGYADDPPRTIWAWRDWVIRAINSNMPFDQFTVEQMAGDMLPGASDDQVIATAFHRNTMTNSEGGTIDEEFRNVAVVDRVNTVFAVWMGTTMACAQCHTHKYDPITQDEYFQVFAILNNTQDADRRDESPTLPIYTDEQQEQRSRLENHIADLRATLSQSTPELVKSQQTWEKEVRSPPQWTNLIASQITRSSGSEASTLEDGSILVSATAERDSYTVELPLTDDFNELAAIRIETLPHKSLPGHGAGHADGNFVITGIRARVIPKKKQLLEGRFVRVTNVGSKKILSLAEVEIFQGSDNIAEQGRASQSSTDFNGPPEYAIDGITDGKYTKKSTTHTATEKDPWWEVDLGSMEKIEAVQIWNRTDDGLQSRLRDYRIELLDAERRLVWQTAVSEPPDPSQKFPINQERDVHLSEAFADYHQEKFEPSDALTGKTGRDDGWSVGGRTLDPHQLVLLPEAAVSLEEPSTLEVIIDQNSSNVDHLLGHFRIAATADTNTVQQSRLPSEIVSLTDLTADRRSPKDSARLAQYYREHIAPELQEPRQQLDQTIAELNSMNPVTTVPVLREIIDRRRETHLQYRGNWQNTGHQVMAGVPAALHPAKAKQPGNRLALAEWIVSEANPLTARVLVNRYWEALYGRGLVRTSEDFGSQGALPTHPELLDWLAAEMIRIGWNRKAMLKQLVMSATYRQSSLLTNETATIDPDNRWLSRGPRIRLSAEMVRDQALAVSDLLSPDMYGPPVRPPQPIQGLTAAFGSSTDWTPSEGKDRYRRGLYTLWRRSNPYPSMATFDAPNREVCTVRRNTTNTPLQSLVTLNDPVYVEAAQSLARNALLHGPSRVEQITWAFRHCLIRLPTRNELQTLTRLFNDARLQLSENPEESLILATDPLGPLPENINTIDAAAMTVVGNVLLNLDEMFLKR
ncbi:MAG: DUF1553 domain-containing protein [Fuerstiella sp.]|nr:DUF1553 domain-containing protein [Fuerstiella sp.]